MSQSGLSPKERTEAIDAFTREAQLLASLQHPHLPRIYDYFTQAGRWYLVMDFLESETLEFLSPNCFLLISLSVFCKGKVAHPHIK